MRMHNSLLTVLPGILTAFLLCLHRSVVKKGTSLLFYFEEEMWSVHSCGLMKHFAEFYTIAEYGKLPRTCAECAQTHFDRDCFLRYPEVLSLNQISTF